MRHPDIYGVVLCASPGGGYRPPPVMPSPLPRAYLVAGTLEPFFLANAIRWADALRDAGADVVMTQRVGSHGDAFWREEFPLMVALGGWTLTGGHAPIRPCPRVEPRRRTASFGLAATGSISTAAGIVVAPDAVRQDKPGRVEEVLALPTDALVGSASSLICRSRVVLAWVECSRRVIDSVRRRHPI
jgi:hypothetical protein